MTNHLGLLTSVYPEEKQTSNSRQEARCKLKQGAYTSLPPHSPTPGNGKESELTPRRFAFQRDGSQVLEESVGGNFRSQRAEKGFIIANFLK